MPNGGIAFGGSGTSRTVTLTPVIGQAGSTTITVNVTDGSLTAHDTFVLSVVAVGCADDGREPDDSIGAAPAVTSGVPVSGTACDDDYSALPVAAGQTINASLAFTNANGNLDLRLYGPTGALLGTSQGTTDAEHITYGPAPAGTYYVRVYPFGGAANHNAYTLTVTAADVTKPTWSGRSPTSGSTGVARDTPPSLTFSEALNPATVTGSSLRLRDTTAGALVSATVSYDAGSPPREPAAGLAPCAGPSLHGFGGHGHPRPGRERVRRRVVVVHRHDGQEAADGVGEDAQVRRDRGIEDREHQGHVRGGDASVDPETTSVRLRDATTGAILAATVSYDARSHRATLNPKATLAARHTYRVLLESSIRDRAGNTLRATGWNFKTGG